MTTFVALYRGITVAEARLIAVSADPVIASDLAARLLAGQRSEAETEREDDPITAPIEAGRRSALRLIEAGVSREW